MVFRGTDERDFDRLYQSFSKFWSCKHSKCLKFELIFSTLAVASVLKSDT